MSKVSEALARTNTAASAVSAKWLIAIALIVVLKPINSSDLWWDLARGRTVFEGSLSPSQDLLKLDDAGEADWLGGLPFYLTWITGGVHGLAAIPVIAGLVFVRTLLSRWPQIDCRAPFVFALALLIAQPIFQAHAMLWDGAGLLTLSCLLSPGRSRDSRLPWKIVILFAIWSQFGRQPIWGLLYLIVSFGCDSHPFRLSIAAVIGGICNPRGVFAWYDNLIRFAPVAFAGSSKALEDDWLGLFSPPIWSFETFVFIAVWAIWLMRERGQAVSPRGCLIDLIPLCAAIISRAHLPICGLWMLLHLKVPTRQGEIETPKRLRKNQLVAIVALVFVLLDGFGIFGYQRQRLGWGIALENDLRLLNIEPLEQIGERLTTFTANRRAAGVAAWLSDEARIAPLDHPERALLAGRWKEHDSVILDILTSHRARYRREDGSWGGWVWRMSDWEVQLLLVSASQFELNRELIETPWQSIDLDSPIVPYVSTDDERMIPLAFENARQQQFVESGPWQPSPEAYSSHGWRIDFLELLSGNPDPRGAVRQSRFFRSINLPLASLRALLPIRDSKNVWFLEEEFWHCQDDLAYQEWTMFGAASRFRRQLLTREQFDAKRWTQSDEVPTTDERDRWTVASLLYVAGDLSGAIEQLSRETPEEQFAIAMLLLELGQSDEAFLVFSAIAMTEEPSAARIGAEFWLTQFAPASSPSR